MASISSAGVGSNLPLNDLIQAELSAKKTQFERRIVGRETRLNSNLSGIGQLKSAISTFNSALQKLAKPADFSGNKVTIGQSADNQLLAFTATNKANVGNYNIAVKQLATGSSFISADNAFTSSSDIATSSAGTLTFSAGGKTLNVDLAANDTLLDMRNKINSASNNFGVSANIINVDGKSRLVIESSVSGQGNDLQVAASNADLQRFSTSDPASVMGSQKNAKDAIVEIDGLEVNSASNKFDNVIQDTSFTVLQLSEKDAANNYKTTKVTVEQDKGKTKENIEAFVKSYNALMDTMDTLGKRPTIVGGERVGDSGPLAGDQTLNGVKSLLFKELSLSTVDNDSLFNVGINIDKKGRLSIDNAKLTKVMDENFGKLESVFSGETGLAKRLDSQLNEYTKSAGSLDKRRDSLERDVRSIKQERVDFDAYLTKYEEGLRQKYARLDVLVARMNSSMGSLTTLVNMNKKS